MMRPDPATLLPLLYEAAAEPNRWHLFFKKLCGQVDASAAALVIRDQAGQRCTLTEQFGMDPEAERLYQAYYGTIDSYFARAKAKGFVDPGSVVSSPAFVSEQELLKTEFGNDFLLRFGILHGCFAVFGRVSSAVGNISLLRGRDAGPFDEAELCVLRFLMPHLETATRLSERFARLRSESEARRVALDQVALGVIFLDGNGKVISMNETATNIFLQNDQSIILRHSRLYAQNPIEDKKLQGLIYKACQTGRKLGDSGGGALVISRKYSRGVIHVLVGPVFDRQGSNSNGPVAVVFITDSGAKIRPGNEILCGLYGLTPAECRLALLLGNGHSLGEIAQMLNLCRSTLKSQLDAIFAKTGTRRQSQLMRTLVLLPQQVYMEKGSSGRMETPGKSQGPSK